MNNYTSVTLPIYEKQRIVILTAEYLEALFVALFE